MCFFSPYARSVDPFGFLKCMALMVFVSWEDSDIYCHQPTCRQFFENLDIAEYHHQVRTGPGGSRKVCCSAVRVLGRIIRYLSPEVSLVLSVVPFGHSTGKC